MQKRTDRILLQNMIFFGYHGVLSEERKNGQKFSVDLIMETDLREAAITDDLANTVNYAEVFAVVKQIVENNVFHLIEKVAGTIADKVLEQFALHAVTVTVRKLTPPIQGIMDFAAVEITRVRHE